MRFGTIPPEPPAITSLDVVAPQFRVAVLRLLGIYEEEGHPLAVRESLRTAARQAWLWGFGRSYDDGRGIVTNVSNIWTGWHPHGLAVDLVSKIAGDNVPQSFWDVLHNRAESLGLVAGIRVGASEDNPHIQWGHGMRVTPSWRARVLVMTGGEPRLWRAVGAA